ncbi:MAG: holo-ACP synthase [Nitrospinae bacterium]|nr:holo-ACP synthase [Nitrospinota bacterium]
MALKVPDLGADISVGADVCDPRRIQRSIERHGDHFIRRVFTKREAAYCQSRPDPYPSYAARFAAKEAVMKVLGTGMRAGFTNIEITHDKKGAPRVTLRGTARRIAKEAGIDNVAISLSHEKGFALAFAAARIR